MPTTTIGGHHLHVDDEGFLTDPDEWNEELGTDARRADRHRADRRALEADPLPARGLRPQGETATLRRVSTPAGIPIKELFELFPEKPAKKMAYVAGLPKPAAASERPVRTVTHARPIMTTTETAPLVPSFDDEASVDRKLAIICSKGNLDMAYPGLILANAALGEGIETHLFFTFWGFDMINKKTMGDLKFTLLGNTATHLRRFGAHAAGLAAARHDRDGHPPDEEVRSPTSTSPRCRSSSSRSRLRRPPVGLPDVRGHAAPARGGPLRRGRGHHQRHRLHREDRRRAAAVHLTPDR